MVTNVSEEVGDVNLGFSVFDQLSYSDSSLPLGNVLSAERVREFFADTFNGTTERQTEPEKASRQRHIQKKRR